ncbi:MAG: putative LPS assembly protein LptD [Vicinamibacterales bacterium]
MRLRAGLSLVALVVSAVAAGAQTQVPGFKVTRQFNITVNGSYYRLTGEIEMEQPDQQFFADVVDYWSDTGRLEASGNVVYVSKTNRIAADRLEFNTKTRLGTFYHAFGTATLVQKVERSLFGGQEPDAYFYGETIEKLGPEKYKITRGGFTTCVQPTPRWEITASSIVMTVDKYALLRRPILKVKDVPLFYAPILYYPINKEDRATGFLIPMYGTSTLRGSSLSNAFFWAISRSADATVFHDWFAQTGQGLGGEYRYIRGPGSDGTARTYFLKEHAAEFRDPSGVVRQTPDRRSYQIRANMQQVLPWHLRARGNVDYFSDVTVQQTYNGNVYDASRRTRAYGGNLAGAWGANSVSATYNVSQVFFGATDSTTYGGTPRLAFNRAARKLGGFPVYWSFGSEYAALTRTSESGDVKVEQGQTRVDFSPSVRVPFTHWPFLSVNSSATWRNTYYTQSLAADGSQVDVPLFRQYFDLRTDLTGPVFTRIFDTPKNGYAEKFKHVFEPNFNLQRLTSIQDFDRIVKLESVDYAVGDVTKIGYGLTNRLLAKRRQGTGTAATNVREFVNVQVFQSYYTDSRASQFDPSFASSFGGAKASNFSPVVVAVRASPTDDINGIVRLEYDHVTSQLATVRANGQVLLGKERWLTASGGWSKRYIAVGRTDNYLNADTQVKLADGKYGGIFNFNYDFARASMLQKRILGFYNAQCCGLTIEYQTYNYPFADPRFPIPQDRRFNVSFTLAGVGAFSNFFGAFGGTTSTRR